MRLVTDESVSRLAIKNAEQADDRKRRPERAGKVLGVDERPGDALGQILGGRHRCSFDGHLDGLGDRADVVELSARTYTVFTRPARSASSWSCESLR